MLYASVYFVISPEKFVRNMFMKTIYIQTVSIFGIVYFSTLLYSFFKILPRKYAILISNDFLIDNSKYESLGKIRWDDISKIQKLKKRSIEIYFKEDFYKVEEINILKRFLTIMHNWNYKKSTIISSALIDSSTQDLFNEIMNAYKANKNQA